MCHWVKAFPNSNNNYQQPVYLRQIKLGTVKNMCRNIKVLYNFEHPATDEEIHASSLQFVRKVSGFLKPSKVNQRAFDQAVKEISLVTRNLLDSLVTDAQPQSREVEASKARERALKRCGAKKY